MKNKKIVVAVILGTALALICTSCGAKGGTLTLVNDSSYRITDARISLGDSKVDNLYPGQRMSASVETDTFGANLSFAIADLADVLSGDKAEDNVEITGCGKGVWALGAVYSSPLLSVNNGEKVTITVKNKKK